MNKSLKVVMSAGLFAMLMIGCGSDGDSKNVSTSDLKGDWTSLCSVDTNDGTSEQDFHEYTDTRVMIRTVIYDNLTCETTSNSILHDMTMNFNYSLGDNFTTVNGEKTTEVDLTYSGFDLVEGTVSDLPTAGTKFYTILYLENKKLYTAEETADKNGTSAETRLVQIDFLDPMEKQ